MELECVLLGLISMHQGITGYELNRIMSESTGYLISASLSHIYPSLKKLNEGGLVSFQDLPIKNRLAKKIYYITPAGETALQEWLQKPVDEKGMDFNSFCLKMAFSPLMDKKTILEHIDREIYRLETNHKEKERDTQIEMDYLNKEKFDYEKAQLLWSGINHELVKTNLMHLEWLIEWRQKIELEVKN